MIEFIKWVIQQYKAYKMCETLKLSTEEREKLILEENEEEKRIEAELREKYNPDNLFKKNKYEQEPSRVTETALIKAEDSTWYKNFINKIIKFFKNKLLK